MDDMVKNLTVKTGLRAGMWWLQEGYIGLPGKPMCRFSGWWFGSAPVWYNNDPYYPSAGAGLYSSEGGAPSAPGAPGSSTGGTPTAPSAPY